MAIFSKTVTLIFDFDLDRLPCTCYQKKGIVTRYTHVKYEGPIKRYGQCKSFCGQTNGLTDKWTGQTLYPPDL